MTDLVAVEHHISRERLSPYLRVVGDDLVAAVELYEWNAAVSASLWQDVGHLEVLVRNAMHDRLTQWSTATYGQPRWYEDPGKVFTPKHTADVEAARQRLARLGRRDNPGRMVAELNFGFWRYLVASHYDRTLWIPALRHGFPHLMGRGSSRDLHRNLAGLNDLRNRIGHWEPIHNRPLIKLHTWLLTIAEWINPAMRDWIKQQSKVAQRLAERPRSDI